MVGQDTNLIHPGDVGPIAVYRIGPVTPVEYERAAVV
jgi:hypothetical protein